LTIESRKASNSSVKPEPVRAHGGETCFTPHLSQETRGIEAFSTVFVLKEVQMPPLLLLDVVDAASLGAAGRTGEPVAPREADVQIELFTVAVKLGSQHDPRGGEA
jgi:hypothetical protein